MKPWRRVSAWSVGVCAAAVLGACSDDATPGAGSDAADVLDAADAGGDAIAPDADVGDGGDADDDGADITPDGQDADDAEAPDQTDVDIAEELLIRPRFELSGDDFFRMPWPSDYRVQDNGRVDLSDFPRQDPETLAKVIEVLEAELTGYSTMPVVYVELDQDPGDEALPDPAETLANDSVVQLVDVSADGCGDRVPLRVEFDAEGHTYLNPNVLIATPVEGFPLRQVTPYAFIVTRSFGQQAGEVTAVAPNLRDLLSGDHPDQALQDSFQPLLACGATNAIDLGQIAVATVFTTQDAVSTARLVRDAAVDPEATPAPEIDALVESADDSEPGTFRLYRGSYETPIYQMGESPYDEGGGFAFDQEGQPAIQRWEAVPFAIAVPWQVDGPSAVLVWQDGTGSSLLGPFNDTPILEAIDEGLAVATFSPQFHDERAVPGSNVILHSFNVLNPESGRTVFRQQAVDVAYFVRLLREGLPAWNGDKPSLNTQLLVYGGHSQGGLVGGIVAGIETEFEAFVLNGTGGYISATIIGRKDPIDLVETFRVLLEIGPEDPITVVHPVVQLVQMGTDVVDPHNYATSWRGWPGNPSGSSVFILNGALDQTTPMPLMNMITIAGDLAPILDTDLGAPGWDVDPYGVWDREPEALPIEGNRTALDGSPLTMATYLDAEQGHGTIYGVPSMRAAAVGLWVSGLSGDTPRLE